MCFFDYLFTATIKIHEVSWGKNVAKKKKYKNIRDVIYGISFFLTRVSTSIQLS